MILDVDMAHEDMHAALFLLQHPNVDLKAITVSGTGEAHCGPVVENSLGLVRLAGQDDIPVACGRDTPLVGDHVFPVAWRDSADRAYGLGLPQGGEPSLLSAPELILEAVAESGDPVTVLAVGPLTNVAEALQSRTEVVDRIKAIYLMGGVVTESGNVGTSGVGIENPYAEWNIYVDPAAANIVFGSGVPVTLVPLDATQDVPVTRKFYNSLDEQADSPAANFVHEMLGANLDFVDSGGFQLWDSLTAAISTDESLAEFKELELLVVKQEGPESGYTRPTDGGFSIRSQGVPTAGALSSFL